MKESLGALEPYIPECSKTNPAVSSWSVGMQIHHALLAARGISEALIRSSPGMEKQSMSFVRLLILLTGRIPRGRGQAPDEAIPSESVTEAELRELLGSARTALGKAAKVDPRAWWRHYLFGVMHRDTALRFVDIHTRHHAAIINDILSGKTS